MASHNFQDIERQRRHHNFVKSEIVVAPFLFQLHAFVQSAVFTTFVVLFEDMFGSFSFSMSRMVAHLFALSLLEHKLGLAVRLKMTCRKARHHCGRGSVIGSRS